MIRKTSLLKPYGEQVIGFGLIRTKRHKLSDGKREVNLMKKKCLFIFILFVMFFPIKVFALNEVNLYLFWGNGCPHCEDEMTFLNELEQRYTNIRIYKYETWYNKDNKEHLKSVYLVLIIVERKVLKS